MHSLARPSHAFKVKGRDRGASESMRRRIKTYSNAVSLAVDIALGASVITSLD